MFGNSACSVLITFLFIGTTYCQIPDYIHVCKRTVPNINQCIIDSIEHLESYLKVGIPELDVPSLEPLLLNETISMNIGHGDTVISTNLSQLAAYGASAFKINKLWADLNKNSFRFNVTVPVLVLKAHYEIDTKLLFLHIAGSGVFTANVDKYNFLCELNGHKIKVGKNEYLKFNQLQCEIQFEKATIHLDNLFNGNEVLGNAINAVINDNVDIFFNEIKDKLTEAIDNAFTDIANKITLRFTYDELFPTSTSFTFFSYLVFGFFFFLLRMDC